MSKENQKKYLAVAVGAMLVLAFCCAIAAIWTEEGRLGATAGLCAATGYLLSIGFIILD